MSCRLNTLLLMTAIVLGAFVAFPAFAGASKDLADNKRGQKEEKDKAPEKKHADNGVPDTAKVVDEGKDKEFSYKADNDGTAYLWDNTNNKLIQTFNLHSGDRLTISPKSNATAVNQKTVKVETNLDRHVYYKLLFDIKK